MSMYLDLKCRSEDERIQIKISVRFLIKICLWDVYICDTKI